MNTENNVNSNDSANTKTMLFRRYPNRKLYSVDGGFYVNMGDLIETIRAGFNVIVRDSKTGQDATRAIVERALFRVERERLANKSVEELLAMIASGNLQ